MFNLASPPSFTPFRTTTRFVCMLTFTATRRVRSPSSCCAGVLQSDVSSATCRADRHAPSAHRLSRTGPSVFFSPRAAAWRRRPPLAVAPPSVPALIPAFFLAVVPPSFPPSFRIRFAFTSPSLRVLLASSLAVASPSFSPSFRPRLAVVPPFVPQGFPGGLARSGPWGATRRAEVPPEAARRFPGGGAQLWTCRVFCAVDRRVFVCFECVFVCYTRFSRQYAYNQAVASMGPFQK